MPMLPQMWLRFTARGGSLTFSDATSKRIRVLAGERFQVDQPTGLALLSSDPWVQRDVDPAVDAVAAPPPVDLGVTPDAQPESEPLSPEDDEDEPLSPGIEALAPVPDVDAGGGDDPPPPPPAGAITITDLPASAKVGGTRKKRAG